MITNKLSQVRSELLSYLVRNVRGPLTEEPRDMRTDMMTQFSLSRRVSVMPPSSLIESMILQVEGHDWQSVQLNCESVQWRPHAKWLYDQLPREQVFHRSRVPVVSCSFLRAAEAQKKITAMAEHYDDYKALSIGDTKSQELFDMIFDLLPKAMSVDLNHIYDFISDHKTSSIGGGYRWTHCLSLYKEDWLDILQEVLAYIEDCRAHPLYWNRTPYNYGIRGRAGEIPPKDLFANNCSFNYTRSRMVMFHPSMSTWSAFLPNKKEFYTKGFAAANEILGTDTEIVTPYTHGGQLYAKASDWFMEGRPFRAYDGKNWESGMATILGKYFNTQMININGIAQLPSGHALTSFLNTIASSSCVSGGSAVISGDDVNVWGNAKVPNSYPLEFQPEDTDMRFILGLSYKYDPRMPRICGFKMTMDKATDMKSLGQLPLDSASEAVAMTRKRDKRQLALHAGMFFGRFGQRSLIEAVRDMELHDWTGFTDSVESVIMEDSEIDALAWAEDLGVKKVFT